MNTILNDYDDIIVRYTVHQWDAEPESSRFKAEIQFTDIITSYNKEESTL
ncbi:hypothetical protein QUF90_05400 [Desulfococcaceae bacterium HSG9]|nr:hypothetical protein [Desulfococcaceae bacterium HSG9]